MRYTPALVDEGVRLDSQDSGDEILCVVPATRHLDQSIQSTTDEHQAALRGWCNNVHLLQLCEYYTWQSWVETNTILLHRVHVLRVAVFEVLYP